MQKMTAAVWLQPVKPIATRQAVVPNVPEWVEIQLCGRLSSKELTNNCL